MKVISLFSGCGGADLGFENMGAEIRFACDIEPVACDTYNQNLISICRNMSVGQALEAKVFESMRDVDVIIGGPPCQSFSSAKTQGKFSGSGMKNIWDYLEVVNIVEPHIFILENSPNFLTKANFAPWLVDIKDKFSLIGYRINTFLLNTEDFGIPQSRQRMFLVGMRDRSFLKHLTFSRPKTKHWSYSYTGWADYLGVYRFCTYHKRASDIKGSAPNEACNTITGAEQPVLRELTQNTMSGTQMHTERRALNNVIQTKVSIEDLAKLQGFPSMFKWCGSIEQKRRMIGNAWSLPVARALALSCIETLKWRIM